MRVTRLRACSDDVGRSEFVGSFERRRLTASASRLSRWEYGQSGSSYRLLRAYEDGAGLPPFLLFALNDRQRRATEDAFSPTPTFDVTEGIGADDIYLILDRVVLGREVTGSEWYALAAFASSNGYFYLSPANTRLIARRLLVELARSIGPGYILRFEAMHLLASMPRVDVALIEEFMALVAADSTGMIGDAVSLVLRPAPAVARALAQQLRDSGTAAAQQSAAWIEDVLRDRSARPDPAVKRSELIARRDQICSDLPAWASAKLEDEITKPLVDTALGGRSRLQRHEASLLLMVAGVQETVEAALLDVFEVEKDPLWRMRLANLHEYLIPPGDPGRLEALALAEQHPEVRRALWNSRGHSPESIEPSEELLDQLGDPEARGSVTVALGLSGSVDENLLARSEVAAVRPVLEWWQEQGPALNS
ncbi:hypothetical protein [Marmoricola sp. OAE513]|uniref:hypothetical protein n=1 Tax=Marmoricola sp. OAE513 TaxID=2817894 RepID=UPI001AEA574A